MPEFIRGGSDVTITRHSAKEGEHDMAARVYEMLSPMEMPSFEVAVVLRHKPPRSGAWRYTYIVPGGFVYYTIEKDGEEIYDSRTEVPCWMEMFYQLEDLMMRSGFSETSYFDHLPYEDDMDFEELSMLFEQQHPKPNHSPRRRRKSRAEVVDIAMRRVKD